MAIAVLVEWDGVTPEQYDEMIRRMNVGGVSLPGGIFHVAGPTENGWRVVDVWESEEVLRTFVEGTLMPLLKDMKLPPPQVSPWPAYNTLSTRLEEVQASRQRIVAAQDAERRRLERNIHDGAQQQLVAVAVKLKLAEALAERDPKRTSKLLHDLRAEADDALETIRELARGIYPPLLAQKGLAAALEAQARRSPIPVEVESDGIERHPQEVEAGCTSAA